MRIFLTGDTHSNFIRFHNKNFKEIDNLTREDLIIILGDVCIFYTQDQKGKLLEKFWIDWLSLQNPTFLFIDGNHDNNDKLQELVSVEMFENEVGMVSPNIFHLRRGHRYIIDGRSFLTCGGAKSKDMLRRVVGYNWWESELLSIQEENKLFSTIEEFPEYDYILTHTVPLEISNILMSEYIKGRKIDDPTEKILSEVEKRISFKQWFFGHFHMGVKIGKFRGLYQQILEL